MAELSVIIPFVQEWPQIVFTIRSVVDSLISGGVDFEVIAVDNFTPAVMGKRKPDPSAENLKAAATLHKWLRYESYTKKQSHWNCKNLAINKSDSPILLFVDAHVMSMGDSIFRMYQYYKENWEELNGSLHLPLTYKILENRRLKYKLKRKNIPHQLHYQFESYSPNGDVVEEVPCMSSCGLMIHRKFINLLGNWPEELGSYGGGENFLNFAGAICGLKKYLFSDGLLYHHGDTRGYTCSYEDYIRNRMIAVYMYGGFEMAKKYCTDIQESGRNGYGNHVFYSLFNSVVDTCSEHRSLIKSRQVVSIEEWSSKW